MLPVIIATAFVIGRNAVTMPVSKAHWSEIVSPCSSRFFFPPLREELADNAGVTKIGRGEEVVALHHHFRYWQ